MWQCPECGRKFTRDNQSHSCVQHDPELLFIGKGQKVRGLYDSLIQRISSFGEIDAHCGKWNLTFRHLSTFLSVIIEKDHLTLVFITNEPIDEFPVYQTYHHSSNRYSNSVKIESEDEIDDQLIRWLQQAWELAV